MLKKSFFLILFTNVLLINAQPTLDVKKYAGTWFVIGSKPTVVDKNWCCISETYAWNEKEYFTVLTHHKEKLGAELKTFKHKLYRDTDKSGFHWKDHLNFFVRVDYLIHKVAEDYSYVIVGHPKHKYLYIMSRTPTMEAELYNELIEFSVQLGYKKEEIVVQRRE